MEQDHHALVLLVSSLEEDRIALRQVFKQSPWRLLEARTYQEALAFLEKQHAPVIISECKFPDGDWRMLLELLLNLPRRSNLIVASRLADESLWAEVLNRGGYDVFVKPFQTDEVLRVTFLAWNSLLFADRSASAQAS